MDDDINIIGGVNNIIKTIIEFQIQSRDMNFYYGTPTQVLSTMREKLKMKRSQGYYPIFKKWDKLIDFISNNEINITEIPVLTDNYNLMEEIAEKIFNMKISRRGIQRIIYNEVKPLDPLKFDLLNHIIIDESHSKDNESENNYKKDFKLKLFDEAKLASRFKDEEIKGIIKPLIERFNEIGKKYFLSVNNDIDFKRSNNTIKVIIELSDKEK